MSLLSQRKNGKNAPNIYINLIIYESHLLLQKSKQIKNIFPYSISIQFNQSTEKLITSIKKAHEIFNFSKTNFKYLVKKYEKDIVLKINCYKTSSSLIKKNFASCVIKLGNINNTNQINNGKIIKKWCFLKDKDNKKIFKILISIDYHCNPNTSSNYFNKEKNYPIYTESEINNNITIINKPEIKMHINSITNNNLNIINNNIYLTNLNISSLDESLLDKLNSTINEKNYKSKNFFANILIKNINLQLSSKFNKLTKQKENYAKQKNINYKESEDLFEEINFFDKQKNNVDNEKQIYENQYLNLNKNYILNKSNLYRNEIQNDINNYEKEILSNIENMMLYKSKLYEIELNSTIHGYFLNNENINLFRSINNNNIQKNKSINNESENTSQNFIPSSTNLMLKTNKNLEVINFSEPKSNSPYSDKLIKERFITDYSRSTFNIENELFTLDDSTKESFKQKQKKAILNIGQIINVKNKNIRLIKNKYNVNKNNNKKNNSNLSSEKKKKKKIDINNDSEFNIYYNLENKKKENLNSFSNSNNNNLKNSILNKKANNNFIKNNNHINNKKNFNYNRNIKKLNNQVFKNVFNPKNNNTNFKTKFVKKEKISSNITFNTDNPTLNNTTIGINTIMSKKIKSFENTTSRISHNIKYKTNKNLKKAFDNSKINSNSKKLMNNKTKLFQSNQKSNNKQFVKKGNELIKRDVKNIKDNNKYQLSKIVKKSCNTTETNFFKNKIIKKKSDKILFNSKKRINFLVNQKTFDNSSTKTNYKKLSFCTKIKRFNPLECNNLTKNKKYNRHVITIENINDNNHSIINAQNLKNK